MSNYDTEQALAILDVSPDTHTYQQGYDRYRYLAKKHHPDKGGDAEKFKSITNAWEIAKPLLPKPKHRLPLVELRHAGDCYLRWTEFFDVGGHSNEPPYRAWSKYYKKGNIYECLQTFFDASLPKSEQRLEHGVSHHIKISNKPHTLKPLRIKLINQAFVVIVEEQYENTRHRRRRNA